MSESIFSRVQRVVSAGVDSAVGVVERANSTGLMREAMRDADRAIDRVVAERETAGARRRNAEARLTGLRAELATLGEQARFAMERERADLAEVAVTRQVELEDQVAQLDAVRAQAVLDDARLEAVIADLREQRGRMKEELAALRSGQGAAVVVDEVAAPIDVRMARRVGRAAEAFDRALELAGGVTGRSGTGQAAEVADIEALRRQAVVAERLAALKAGETPPAERKRPAGKRAAR